MPDQLQSVPKKMLNVLDAIPTQAKKLVRKVKPGYGDAIDNALQNTVTDTADWVFTLPRCAQVILSGYANGNNDPNPHHPLGVDGSDYGNSAFDKMMYHQNADGSLSLTHAGMAMVGVSGGVGVLSGIARGIYKHQHQKHLFSRKRLRAMMGRHLTEEEERERISIEEEKQKTLAEFMRIDALRGFENEIKKINADRKNGDVLTEDEKTQLNGKFNAAFENIINTPENKIKLDNLIAAYQRQDATDKAIAASKAEANEDNPYQISIADGQFVIQRTRGSVFNKQRNAEKEARTGIHAFLHKIRKLDNHRYMKRIAYPFNWMINQSMWYWLVWFMAFLIAGPVLLASAPVIISLGAIAAGIGTLISVIKGVSRFNAHSIHKKQRADIATLLRDENAVIEEKDPLFKNSVLAMKTYYADKLATLKPAKQAAFLLRKYQKYQAKDGAIANEQLTAWKSRTFMTFEHDQNLKKIEAIRTQQGADAIAEGSITPEMLNGVNAPEKDIMRYLSPSKHERRLRAANNVIGAMAFGFVIPFFITQLLGGILAAGLIAAFGVTILSTSSIVAGTMGILNGALLSTVWGGLWAAKNGLTTFIGQRNSKSAYQQKLNALNEVVNGESKIQKFNKLQHSYDKKLAYLKLHHKNLYETMQKELVDSKHWSATNHHYHEKQRAKATPWTRIKQAMNRAYEVIGGAETGVLVTRVLFLGGCVLGFALAGAATVALTGVTFGLAPIVFSVIAGVLGGILGANRLAKYHFGKRQEHREKFVNTFDDRLAFLEQKNNEMDKLLGIAPVAVVNAAHEPDQADQAPVVNVAPQVEAMPLPAPVPGREERVRATTESITRPNTEKTNETGSTTPPSSDVVETKVSEKINTKLFVSMAAIKHSLLFKPAVAMDNTIEKAFEDTPRPVASPAA